MKRMWARTKLLSFAGMLFLTAWSTAAPASSCSMSPGEKQWIERALSAWNYMRLERLRIPPQADPVIVLFNDKCRFEAKATSKPIWRAEPHAGVIRLPNGGEVEAGVISATMSNEKTGEPFFVMALPSVWEAAKIVRPDDRDGLAGVFLHELSHVVQAPVLSPFWKHAKARYGEPEDLNDDQIQRVFQKDPAYVAVAEKERDLLFRAAMEPDEGKAKSLVRDALALREARQKRWFTGSDAVWQPYDEIFLTMEGFGQWVAYAWLSDPKGGGLTLAEAQTKMRGGRRWWSQDTGFSAFLVIDRFVPDWPARAFAPRPALAIDLLRIAAAEKGSPAMSSPG
jgi:hypothetical protein